jgi:hypothetical protein
MRGLMAFREMELKETHRMIFALRTLQPAPVVPQRTIPLEARTGP